MRLPTVLISTAFVLAGMSAALPVEKGMLVTRFADSGFLSEVEARTYEEPELYARGCVPSKVPCEQNGNTRPSSFRTASELSLASSRQSDHSGQSRTTAGSSSHSYTPSSSPSRPPSFRTPSGLSYASSGQSDHSSLSRTTSSSYHSYPPSSRQSYHSGLSRTTGSSYSHSYPPSSRSGSS